MQRRNASGTRHCPRLMIQPAARAGTDPLEPPESRQPTVLLHPAVRERRPGGGVRCGHRVMDAVVARIPARHPRGWLFLLPCRYGSATRCGTGWQRATKRGVDGPRGGSRPVRSRLPAPPLLGGRPNRRDCPRCCSRAGWSDAAVTALRLTGMWFMFRPGANGKRPRLKLPTTYPKPGKNAGYPNPKPPKNGNPKPPKNGYPKPPKPSPKPRPKP